MVAMRTEKWSEAGTRQKFINIPSKQDLTRLVPNREVGPQFITAAGVKACNGHTGKRAT